MSKIIKREYVTALPETGDNDTEYVVSTSLGDGGITYVWKDDDWCPISVSNLADSTHDGIQSSEQFTQFSQNKILARGSAIVRCAADSVSYDIALGDSRITSSCMCFAQRTSATTVEDASHIIGCECIAGGIRVYFNKKSTSVYYVKYIVFE